MGMLLKTRVQTVDGYRLEITMGFLEDKTGESYSHISGKLVDGAGKILAMGHIPEVILNCLSMQEEWSELRERAKDFADAHGCNENGIGMDGVENKRAGMALERIQGWFPQEIARFSMRHTL